MTRLVAKLLLLLAGAGCTTDNFGVVLLKNAKMSNDCIVPGSPDAVGIAKGVLDVTSPLPDGSLNPGYTLTPIIQNSATGVGSSSTVGNPNIHLLYVRGANVELVPGTSAASREVIDVLASRELTKRVQRFTTSIPPNGTSGLAFAIIDEEQALALDEALAGSVAQIIARVTVFGTIDGSDIETPPFEYPVTLCRGCLLQEVGDCSALPFGTTIESEGCNPMQDDGSISCCDTSTVSFCPAKSTAPPPTEN